MDLFQIMDNCQGLGPIVRLIKNGLFPIIQIGIPIILIVMGSIDLGKAVLSSDDKEIKNATSRLVKRAIAAVAVFFIVTLVYVIMSMVANNSKSDKVTGAQDWWSCWQDPSGD